MNNGSTSSPSFGPGFEDQKSSTGIPSAQDISQGVKQMASQAGEKLMDQAERQKAAGADYVTGVADAVRRAANEFEDQVPQAAEYIRYAADQMDTMSDSLRRRDVGQMLSDVQSFARRQPTAFLGLSLLAGFAAVRFIRSSAPGGSSGGGQRSFGGSSGNATWQSNQSTDQGRYGSASASPIASMSPPPRGMQEL